MNSRGILAERAAANYLRKKRYQLIDFNYYTNYGEIDLIFTYKKQIIFVEVKERRSDSAILPREYVDLGKRRRMVLTAQTYMKSKNLHLQPRFDIIEVYTKNDKIKSINHLENAFDLDYNI